ncbi:hypothetical protein HDV00_006936 [Rhizophlyctis rosea]|nr:hypothetical protein HDV00_006936 [Rhizophlyctis rosea]
MVPIEDVVQAGAYEQAMKRRPQPFIVQLNEKNGMGHVRIGVNVVSLLHRATASLPANIRSDSDHLQLLWRLTTDEKPAPLKKLQLTSNKLDPAYSQPPNFQVKLRPEQLRSLHWMVKQEEAIEPTFVEEEVAEAELGSLGWRVEAKAARPALIRGGVLADEVGYGKTAITLGLIDVARSKRDATLPTLKGIVSVKATLIVVPGHLVKQWPTEIQKFLGKSFSDKHVKVISTVANLNKLTIADVEQAEVIVMASSVFKSAKYLENFADFSGAGGRLPTSAKGGRHFETRYETMIAALRERVSKLSEGGRENVRAVLDAIEAGRNKGDDTEVALLPSKRLVGKQYHEQHNVKRVKTESTVTKTGGNVKTEGKGSKLGQSAVRKTKKEVEEQNSRIEFYVGGKRKTPTASEPASEDEEEEIKVRTPAAKKTRRIVIESDDDEDYVPAPKKGGRAMKEESESESEDQEAEDDEEEVEEAEVNDPSEEENVPQKAKPKKKVLSTDPWGLKTLEVQRDWKKMTCPPMEMFNFNRIVVDEFTYSKEKEHTAITRLNSSFNWVLSGTPPLHDFTAVKSMAVFLRVHLGIDDDAPLEGRGRKNNTDKTDAEQFHAYREVRSAAWHARRHQVAQMFLDKFVRQNIAEIDEIPTEEKLIEVVLPAAERAIYLELEHHLQAMEMNTKKTIKSAGKGKHGDRESRLKQALGSSQSAEEALLKRCSHFDELDGQQFDDARGACEAIVAERKQQLEECQDDLADALEKAKVSYAEVMKFGGFQDPAQNKFVVWQKEVESGLGDDEADEIIKTLLKEGGFDGKTMPKPRKAGELAPRAVARAKRLAAAKKESGSAGKGKGKEVANGKGKSKGAAKGKAKAKAAAKGKGKKKAKDSDEEDDFEEDSEGTNSGEEEAAEEEIEQEEVEYDDETGEKKKKDKKPTREDKILEFRELTHVLRRYHKELVGRVRSLRYFAFVRDVQTSRDLRTIQTSCATCKKTTKGAGATLLKPEDIAVLSCCGHTGCYQCLKESAEEQLCPVKGCKAPARVNNVVRAATLGKDDAQKSGRYGAKLQALVELLKKQVIAKKERALVFVQFADLMEIVAQALADAKIPALQVLGSTNKKSGALERFQEVGNDVEPVLLLALGDERASGANLTTANHAIFFNPLLADTQEDFDSQMTQAIGRVRRYGQTKDVKIWRMLTLDTIDTEIWNERKQDEH